MESFESLTPNEFANSVKRTANSSLPVTSQVINCCFALAEEYGEFIGLLKKAIYHDHDVKEADYEKELGDILFYSFWLCQAIDDKPANIAFAHLFAKEFLDVTERSMGSSIPAAFADGHSAIHSTIARCNAYLIAWRRGYDIDVFKMEVEGLVLHHLRAITELCNVIGLKSTWGKIAHMNQQKLLKRYPRGFSTTDSKNRVE